MIQLVASDLDGTILQNDAQHVSPRIFELIMELKRKGILFAAASGRQYSNLRGLFEPVKDEISYIAENGSLCIHKGQVLSRGIMPDATKGNALSALLDHLHIPAENCMAFGDQYNDVEMLQLAGEGYAMSNAAPGIAYYSDYVTDSVEEVLEDLVSSL